jgi:integrase
LFPKGCTKPRPEFRVSRLISLGELQVVLGHADITTTRLYVQTSGLEVAVEMAGWF